MRYIAVLVLAFALVVGVAVPVHADSPLPTAVNVLGAANATVILPSVSNPVLCIVRVQGTFVGTITFKSSTNGGSTYPNTMSLGNSTTAASTTTNAVGDFLGSCGVGTNAIEAQMTSYTSGAAYVQVIAVPWFAALSNLNIPGFTATASGGVGGTVNQGTAGVSPWVVVTPLPAPTGAHGAVGVEGITNGSPVSSNMCDPSTGTQCASVDVNGVSSHKICDTSVAGRCAKVTATNNLQAAIFNGTNVAGVDASGNLRSRNCDASNGANCQTVDGNGNGSVALNAIAICHPMAKVTASGNTVVKNSSGTFCGYKNLDTTAAQPAITCYDNATTNAGSIFQSDILSIGAGVAPPVPFYAQNGITCNMASATTTAGIEVYGN